MLLNTRLFGEIEVEDEKVIFFEKGIIGFPHCQRFTLIYDETEDGKRKNISWLQSIEEPAFALPVMDPLLVKEDYDPQVEHDLLKGLGTLTEENLYVLVTVTVPTDIKKLSVNLKAPVIINVAERRAEQLIVEDDFPVKYPIYEILQSKKEKAGE